MKLSEAAVGSKVRIRNVYFPSSIQGRILGLGFVPGTVVEVVRSAPLGDPRVYRVRGKLITLRNDEASYIDVEPVGEVIPLSMASIGKSYRIVSVRGGRGFVSKIRSLGLREGVVVEVVERYPMVVRINGEMVKLGMGMVDKILVEEI